MDKKHIAHIDGTAITHYFADTMEDVRTAAASKLSSLLSSHSKSRVLFLVSGGSALSVLDLIDPQAMLTNIDLCIIDERFGVGKEDQNYHKLSQTKFAQAFISRGGRICSGGIDGAHNLQEAGDLFDRHLKRAMKDPHIIVIALLGVGSDGHTAGIMPSDDRILFTQRFDAPARYAVGYDAGVAIDLPLRITTTLSFLRSKVDHAVVFAPGYEKMQAVTDVLTPEGVLPTTPGRIIREMKEVALYTSCTQEHD